MGWQTKEQKRKNGSIRIKSRLKGKITNENKLYKKENESHIRYFDILFLDEEVGILMISR